MSEAEVDARSPSDLDAPTQSSGLPVWLRGRRLSDGSQLFWWKQLVVVLAVYLLYEMVRNRTQGSPDDAFRNALTIIDWQQTLGIYHEPAIQQWALDWMPVIIASNYFYGSMYFVVTLGAMVWLYRKRTDDYPLWRNTLAIGTTLGLIGFALFPLMPPRLLDVMGDGRVFGYVDTLIEYPTFWSFDSETMRTVSNPFAAMPSLHCGWAFWAFGALYPRVRTQWARALIALYPIATIFAVVVTANHYVLDAVGGLVIFVVGYGAARLVTRAGRGPAVATDDGQGPYSAIALR